jgi:hypothetical protein
MKVGLSQQGVDQEWHHGHMETDKGYQTHRGPQDEQCKRPKDPQESLAFWILDASVLLDSRRQRAF